MPDHLAARLARRDSGYLLFGLTPPRRSVVPEEAQRIADVTLERLGALDLDGLLLYDIVDESDRTDQSRPFPYLPTIDPADYLANHLGAWERSVVVYRCVGKYTQPQLETWLRDQDPERVSTVFVGAASRELAVQTTLADAQELRGRSRPEVLLGAVAIPERHAAGAEEHARLLAKAERGCSFFITQVVYDAQAARNLVSDYYYACRDSGTEPAPVIFTLSVCGSLRTLEFLRWLGVQVPRWMENSLRHSDDTLEASLAHCLATAHDLAGFCRSLGMPFGFSVESVSIRKAEIDAAVTLAHRVRAEVL
ncbi:methylenetetrahydrofolate reductase [Nocardioides allogilvus]|uniref:methylenetetrahydrofolate reductase n=1 Tax=Nocardioides allogilvus TaxID=2072017 RepID=UPI000D31722E|nr:methylenetetrahydrofolate reductase [Nocardioides allogilvus]